MRLVIATGVGLGQAEPRDGVARRADRRRLGERAGDDARRRAGVVAEEPADDVSDDQPGRRDDRRQRRLLQAVALETAEELRPGPEADREQEEQEERLLDFARHLHAELADGDAGEQRAGDGAEREAPQLQLPEQVAKPEHEEERHLGMLPKDAEQRARHDLPLYDRPCARRGAAAACDARNAMT